MDDFERIPEIADRGFQLDDGAVAVIASATGHLAQLNSAEQRHASLNALTASLLRSESAASSRIEGIAISQKRLARAMFSGSGRDSRAAEVLGNVEAMRRAVELGTQQGKISIEDICDLHRVLLRHTADRRIAGEIRREQNWIGGNDYNPIGAAYVPPPPEHVPALLEDLCAFLARDDLAPVAHAAIAHAQFENIHPFADGNGRVGRALIHVVLRRRGQAIRYVPPISLVLAAAQRSYIGGLEAFRAGDVSSWCETFGAATERAAAEVERMASQIENRQLSWLERLGNPRRNSSARRLVGALPEQPVIDVATACRLTGTSHVSSQKALAQLEQAGILRRLNERKWGRVWECDELLELVEELEASVATGPET